MIVSLEEFKEERSCLTKRWKTLGALLALPKISASSLERKQIESGLIDECEHSFSFFKVLLLLLILLGLVGFDNVRGLINCGGDPASLIENMAPGAALTCISLLMSRDPSHGLDILKKYQKKVLAGKVDSDCVPFLAQTLLYTPLGEEQKRVVDALSPSLTSWTQGVPVVDNLLKSGAQKEALVFCARLLCENFFSSSSFSSLHFLLFA